MNRPRREPKEVADLVVAGCLAALCIYASLGISNAVLVWVAQDFAWVRQGPTAYAFAPIGWQDPMPAFVAFSIAMIAIYTRKTIILLVAAAVYTVLRPVFSSIGTWSGSTYWHEAVRPMAAYHSTLVDAWQWLLLLFLIIAIGTMKRIDARLKPSLRRRPVPQADAANSA